jgi:Carboxypeptidase regulatory-like domain/TonB dependent receptor
MKSVLRGVFVVSAPLILACAFATQAGAQSATTGAIIGTVTDPSGAAVPDAAVGVVDTDTGIPHNVTTNDDGFYSATSLQPGTYTVTVNKTGFAVFTHSGIVVTIGSRLTVDAALPLVSTQATVTVTGQTPLLETQKTAMSQTVSDTLVAGLPINGRRWEDFVLLTPAVTADGGSGLSSFRGISGLYNGNTVDGANNTQAFFSEARGRAIIVAYVYSADSIEEFQVNNSNYSAEYGQAAGGVVNAVTKSGTNQLHGDVFYNLRYPSLNALDPVAKESFAANGQTPTQTTHQQQQFGGSIGTPIKKDKLFFFGTYDGFRKVNPILYTTTAGSIGSLICPTQVTTTQCTAAEGFITSDLLGAFPRDLKQNVGLGKLDYQLSPANHLSAVVNIQDWDEPDGYNTSPTVSNAGVTVNGFGATHERFVIGNWTSTFGGNKVNDMRFQWGKDYEYDLANAPGPFTSLSSIVTYGETSALPRPAFPDEHRYEMSDDFTVQKGNHSIKLGVDVNLIHELLVNLFQGDGNYAYSSPALPTSVGAGCLASAVEKTFCGWVADLYNVNLGDTYSVTTGDSAVTPFTPCVPTTPTPATPTAATCYSLTGKHYSTFTQVEDPITHVGEDDFYNNDFGAYLEDTWKARPNLTFNLGLRYDIQHVPQPAHPNNIANDPNATPLQILDTSTINIDKGAIAPRIGIAWQFAKNTVLRMGYGIFFAKTSNSTYYALRVENGIYQQTFSGCSPTNTAVLDAACAPTFPDVYFVPPGPTLAAPFSGAVTPVAICTTTATPGISPTCPSLAGRDLPTLSQAIHGMDPNFVNPRADEGELSLEHQLPGGIAVSATYLVTRGLHLPSSYDANIAPSTSTKTYNVETASGATLMTYTVPFYTARVPGNTTTGIILNQYSVVDSWYNGLVLTIRKPISHSFELLANYTYSKALDDGEVSGTNGTFFGTDGVSDPYNLNEDYSYSDLDQRHKFVGSIVWSPNYVHGENKFARQVLNGWVVGTIITALTGEPYSAMIGTTSVTGGIDGGLSGGVVSTNASATGGRATFLPRNSYRYPTWTNIDLRLERDFAIHERYRLEFRAEAFNLFNSTLVQGVNTEGYTVSGTNIIPFSGFQAVSTTTSVLAGARQLQTGFRFEF